ncbi:ATP-grasp domain-containing protein [Micromonospora sp. SH-82]|uniref:ATP-grasp domain-containing protein n=1 Tax=Micromonospora sp. SH-82 TaxID=3132938 RepID=UPI003EBFE056
MATATDRRRHVVVLHRWRDHHARYADYLDHHADRVTYITTALAAASVPATAAEVVVVDATDDLTATDAALRRLADRFGTPDRLVALNEGDLDTAAALRLRHGLAGQLPQELARYRDKLLMARRVADAGLPVPPFADAPTVDAVREFAARHGWPVVIKPRSGTASRGVARLDGDADLAGPTAIGSEPYLVQRFVDAQILHVDGLWEGDRLGAWRASRYLNTCAEFTDGAYLGSVEIDDEPSLTAIGEFTAAVCAAFSTRPWVFHLETFIERGPDGTPRLSFLEAGARVGGAEIPFIWREVHGVDLVAAAIDIQLGRVPLLPAPEHHEVGGYLLLPTPVPAPCRVTDARWRDDTPVGGGPYTMVAPPPGTVIPRTGGYEHVGARFRFRGASSGSVEAAIRTTAGAYHLACVQVAD